jgi:hypothetical protein
VLVHLLVALCPFTSRQHPTGSAHESAISPSHRITGPVRRKPVTVSQSFSMPASPPRPESRGVSLLPPRRPARRWLPPGAELNLKTRMERPPPSPDSYVRLRPHRRARHPPGAGADARSQLEIRSGHGLRPVWRLLRWASSPDDSLGVLKTKVSHEEWTVADDKVIGV